MTPPISLATENIKQNTIPTQITINFTLKAYLSQFLIPKATQTKKWQRMPCGNKKTLWRDKAVRAIRLRAQTLELPNAEFKITMINILRSLMENQHMQEQKDYLNREMKTVRTKRKC